MFMGAAVQVFVRIDLSQLGMPTSRVVFNREPGFGTTAAHIRLSPISLHKRRATNTRRHGITYWTRSM
jgi:hypothetical protein